MPGIYTHSTNKVGYTTNVALPRDFIKKNGINPHDKMVILDYGDFVIVGPTVKQNQIFDRLINELQIKLPV